MAGLAGREGEEGLASVSASQWSRGGECSGEAPGAGEPEVTDQEGEEEEGEGGEEGTGQESRMLG